MFIHVNNPKKYVHLLKEHVCTVFWEKLKKSLRTAKVALGLVLSGAQASVSFPKHQENQLASWVLQT